MRSLSPGTINIRVLCKQLNRTVLFCGSNVSRTSSIFLLPWCVSSLPRWVGIPGFGQACWLDVEPSLFPVPAGEVDLGPASLGEDLARSHHNLPIVPMPASSSGGFVGITQLCGHSSWYAFTLPSPGRQDGCFTPVPTRLTLAQSLPLEPTPMLGSATLQPLWSHPQKRQAAEEWAQPTSLSTGNNPELEEEVRRRET